MEPNRWLGYLFDILTVLAIFFAAIIIIIC